MPTMSLYAFQRSDPSLAGPFYQNHIGFGDGGWAWEDIYNIGYNPSTSALVWERLDSELVIDLSAAANNPLALNAIDSILTDPASRSGPVRTSYVTWANVPDVVKAGNPNLHQPWELLVTFNIDFHIHTPAYCTDADGIMTYYVFFFLDGGGNLNGVVQGWYYNYSGGWPFCQGSIDSKLKDPNTGIPSGMATLQNLLNTAIAINSAGRTFWMLYLLPGHGDRSGFSSDDADNNVALALLPN